MDEHSRAPQGPRRPVNAKNSFNILSRLWILWNVQHRWAKIAQFAFNCYLHRIRLTMRVPDCGSFVILSREGLTQGNPLVVVLYGVILLPLIEYLRRTHPYVLQSPESCGGWV